MCSPRQHFSYYVILSALLSLWMDLTSGMINIQLIPQYPVIQESVTLSVTGVTGRILSIKWFKGLNTSAGYLILTYIPGGTPPLLPGPLNFPRVSPFPTGSLLISDLNITDSGDYTVQIQTEKAQEQASVTLTVNEFPPGTNVGLIIGILVAVLLVVALVAALYYLFIVRKWRKKPSSNMNSVMEMPTSNGHSGSPSMEQPELQYADIAFKNKDPRKQQPLSGALYENGSSQGQPPAENIVYSEIRLQ